MLNGVTNWLSMSYKLGKIALSIKFWLNWETNNSIKVRKTEMVSLLQEVKLSHL